MTPAVVRAIAGRAHREPSRVAVEHGIQTWAYADLWRESGAVAHRLAGAGLRAGDVVAVVAGRGLHTVAALLGVMRAGGTWLAIDPSTPAPRAAAMLDVAGAAFVLEDGAVTARDTAAAPVDGLAYLAFTSGTTGVPKAVEITRDALDRHADAVAAAYGLDAADRVAHLASPAFDVSAEELWPTLAHGGAVVVLPDPLGGAGYGAFTDTVDRAGVTVVNLPASYFAGWAAYLRAERRPAPAGLRLAVAGSETLTADAVAAWLALPRPPRLINAYGVTEATITSLTHELTGPAADVPIGRPLPGVRAVADPRTGELLLGGDGLAAGYRGRPDLTAERFVTLDVDGAPRRWYRTGDLVTATADGFVFAGRVDDQFSVNGYRIEPGDIEAAARAALPGADARAVLVGVDIVVCVRSAAPVDPVVARTALAAVLPPHMMPTAVVPLDRFPLTAGGKVDMPALRSAAAGALAAVGARSEVTPAALADICAEILGVPSVDDFFACGGDSVSAARLAVAVRRRFGRALTVAQVFATPTIADLAATLHSGQPPVDEPATAPGHDGPAPLTEQQRRIWFLEQLVPGSALYNVPLLFAIDGPVDPAELSRALDEIAARHPVLRTRFGTTGGTDWQVVDPPRPVPFTVVDDRRALDADARAPFDLTTGPLLRAVLAGSELLVTVHHIAFDGWSVGVLLAELAALYGRPGALAPPRRQYADVATRTDESHVPYWRQALARPPEPLELPGDLRPSGDRTRLGAKARRTLPAGLADRVDAAAAAHRASPFMVLFAAFQTLLHRYTGREDIVTGVPTAGRDHPDAAELIGFFTNTLPLRTDLSGDPTFAALLRRVRDTALAAAAHADVPLERIVEESKVGRDADRNPLFDTLFVMMNVPTPRVTLDGAPIRFTAELDNGHAKFDLVLFVDRIDGATVLTAEYATDLFHAPTVERLLGHYETLLAAAVTDPGTPLSRLPLLTPVELDRFAAGPVTAPYRQRPVHELMAEQARAVPDTPAVEFGGAVLTYAEFDRRANRLAHRLRAAGVGPEVVVALCLDRSLDVPVAIFGVLKAGGAYLPIDPAYPAARIALMLAEARPAVLVTQRHLADRFSRDDAFLVVLDDERNEIEKLPDTPPAVDVDAENLAYVLFTSRSTGRPKAVAQPHRMLTHLVAWHRDAGRLGHPARVLQFAALSFDVSAQEFFVTLTTGGTLVLVTEDERRDMSTLLTVLDKAAIERIFVPFAVLQHLAHAARLGPAPAALRDVVAAGEQLHVTPAIAAFLASLTDGVLHNHYGPTETHLCNGHRLDGDPAGWPATVPIGAAMTNAVLRVLDRNGEPTPVGVPGELFVGGVGVARGYHRRPGLTADRFRPDPWTPGGRLYRTGDLVRERADGVFEFLSRADDQVKIRGHRVEPGEVETALTRHPDVSEAVVVAHTPPGGDRRLVAYVVSHGAASGVAPADLRAFVAADLPDHMVPSVFVPLDAIPLSPNGKADRRNLPDPGDAAPAARVAARPLTTLEQAVALVWGEALDVTVTAPDDEFFDLGGHSLVAGRAATLLREALDVEVPLRLLFAHPTVAGFAAALHDRHGAAVEAAAADLLTVVGFSDADVAARLDELSPENGSEGTHGYRRAPAGA